MKEVVCPYCGDLCELVDSIRIYKTVSRGDVFCCFKCDAYVGVHKHSGRPLGTPADKETRQARQEAHRAFDALWKPVMKHDRTVRKLSYGWLAKEMGFVVTQCHIGQMTKSEARKVTTLCLSPEGKKSFLIFLNQNGLPTWHLLNKKLTRRPKTKQTF